MDRVFSAIRRGTGLPFFAACVVGFMVLVILEGAVVRATGSGAGCGNHWPLCNGQVLPVHPRVATIIEFTHRSLTGICTTLTAVLVAWTFLAKPKGDPVRRAAVWSVVFLLTEGALGAVLVLGGYVDRDTRTARDFVQSIHFTNTMLLLAAYTLTWWWMRKRRIQTVTPTVNRMAWLALGSALLTGATGSVAALADTLFPSPTLSAALAEDFAANAPLLIRMRWIHPASAVISLVCAVWLGWRLRSSVGRWIVGLMGVQIVLGVADVLLLAPTWLQVLHLLGADLYWIALIVAAAEILHDINAEKAQVVDSYVNAV